MTYSLAIVKSGFGPDEAQGAVEALLAAKRDSAKLCLFTDHQFDCDRSVVVKNIEGDYGTAAGYLHNTGIAAAASGAPLDYVREGLDLLCLERALGIGRCDCFFLMRHAGTLSDADMIWLERNETDFMRNVPALDGTTNYLFDCRRPLTMRAISLALDLYRSGALLSLDEPSLGRALWLATSVLSKGARARPSAGEEP
ncbi:MAG TPA: hypothetical protein VJN18_24300 [Polyangiaceae bacterium]|nr:hypothetical protein [Polyangiaceae bacterium]